MKLVIDIPEERYKDIQRIAEVQLERNHFQTAEQIIANGVPVDTSGDCISRQAAIDEIEWEEEYGRIDTGKAIEVLKRLPSVEPERKRGKWEYVQYDGNPKIGNWHCSNCRVIVNSGFEGTPVFNYCPICGTKMEVNR